RASARVARLGRGEAGGRDAPARGRERLRRRAHPALDRRPRRRHATARFDRPQRVRPRHARARACSSRLGAPRGPDVRRPRGRGAPVPADDRPPDRLRAVVPGHDPQAGARGGAPAALGMLPRARTAAAGALSSDPVVPLVPRRRIMGLPFGDARSLRREGKFDPIGSRPYRPGDDPRRIDRHASARLSSVSDDVELIVAASAQRARSPVHRLSSLPPEEPVTGLRTGTIVFLVSDFLDFPAEEVWNDVLVRGWDVVPVVLQDPTWEQSFPDVSGVCLPLADATGNLRPALLTRREAEQRRAGNAARFAAIVDRLEELGLEPVVLGTSDADAVYDAFLAWAEGRRSTFAWTG